MGLESLESGFFGAFCDTKSISIAHWEHTSIKPQYIAMAYFDNQYL